MSRDVEYLLRDALYIAPVEPGSSSADLIEQARASAAPAISERSNLAQDPALLAIEIGNLVQAAQAAKAGSSAPPRSSKTESSGGDSGVAGTVLKTAAMVSGVGPLVTGLMKLFGGGSSGDAEPLPPLERFDLPSSVSVEAALTRDRRYAGLRYAQNGTPDALQAPGRQQPSPATPTIQVNIEAMDSQSFLDRQDDIARAVREAMLHSNSLNDVVMEL